MMSNSSSSSSGDGGSGRYQWIRQRDMAYEAHQDAMREAKMDIRWRGVAYYVCVECHQIMKSMYSFYIVPVYNEDLEMRLEPLCHECYLIYTKGETEEIT